MTRTSIRPRRTALTVAALALALTSCSVTTTSDQPATPTTDEPSTSAVADPTPSETPTTQGPGATGDLPTVPGYDVGEFPPVPLFVLPDLGLLEASMTGFTPELQELVGDYPGLTITPARCDEYGELASGPGTLLLYGDGSGEYTGPDGTVFNYGDGSGQYSIDGVEVVNYGDGSGSYDGNGVHVFNYGDGSGEYTDAERHVFIYGDGSGEETTDTTTIFNYGDGSASYDTDEVAIFNYGDGSASYDAEGLSIFNYGDGTANVNGTMIEAEPVDPVPTLGTFPPIDSLQPITACGTTITLDSAVLFDIDQWDIRPDAAAVLDSLAQALIDGDVPAAQVAGHTDSVRDDAWNQTLSENRAAAVAQALLDRGVTTDLSTIGYGEDQPVASNDTAAGRQQNRRVEIFIPAF